MKITENRVEPEVVQQPLQGITIELTRDEVFYIKKYAVMNPFDPVRNLHWKIRVSSSSTVYKLIEAIKKVEL